MLDTESSNYVHNDNDHVWFVDDRYCVVMFIGDHLISARPLRIDLEEIREPLLRYERFNLIQHGYAIRNEIEDLVRADGNLSRNTKRRIRTRLVKWAAVQAALEPDEYEASWSITMEL